MTTFAGLTIRQGDDYSKVLTVTDDDDAAVNLTGCTLTFHLRAPGATTDAITPAPTLTLTDAAHGVATLTLTDTQTAALTAWQDYRYEVECVDGTTLVSTPVAGLCFVVGDGG
jgi:hypothetical protein